ncbi:hypothetical protein [Flavobacterium sp.]|uniref:hypothetical protein n=1 Tax=Flavobacterium sp. TaxID=239 RepID=UPI0025B84AA3|nr:hypothetical protein [Flavobacterium sp.]MBA4155651.1 hypothetical protein [Flavobacterium sp.]
MTSENIDNNNSKIFNQETWFDEFVGSIRLDEQLLKNDLMEPEKKQMYQKLFDGNMEAVIVDARKMSTQYFISGLLNDYVKELSSMKHNPKKLGLELSNSKVLVWAEIYNNDEEAEKALILAQAKVNAQYSKYGFAISSTIVEECDQLAVPNHYHNVAIPAK